ncbi:MAG: signal peptidase I [Lachnospiraceae bacterium]|nr:signal peptidase I [Lachnospiraceae bacterium]
MKRRGLDFRRKRKKTNHAKVIKELSTWAFWIFLPIFAAIAIMYAFGFRTNVIGNAMEPGLFANQQIMINRLIYQISEPKRGDVIAFLPNGNENSHYYVKRVIGMPGEKVRISDGYIYINDERLSEKGTYDKIADPGIAETDVELGKDEYFVLGDNRNFSEDSRSGNIGAIKSSFIIGKVWFKLSDRLENMGFVK